jgi:predicted secreted hydrolase
MCVLLSAATGAEVKPGQVLVFPRDHGSHPQFSTEWWYVTGWLQDDTGTRRGFQITFFRSRNAGADVNPSQFAAKQLMFAHAAIADGAQGRLLRAERSARAGFDLAIASEQTLEVLIDRWSLRTRGDRYIAAVESDEFVLQLELIATQPTLLQGEQGFSRKGADKGAASYYYSLPHLKVAGSLSLEGKVRSVVGQAWFDHEWSNAYVDPNAVGWDWTGINLEDGGALMSFRMRDQSGFATFAGGTLRAGSHRVYAPEEIHWLALRKWRSPRTGVTYPVAWRIRMGTKEIVLRPLMDDQENDARGSVGMLYWEGAVEALDATGRIVGRGYLELTGYGEPARL